MKTRELAFTLALTLALPALAAESGAAANSEAKTKAAKKTPAPAKPKAAEPEPVFNPEPAVAKQNNVNVRGQASITSEVITRLQKGQSVTILEEITLRKPKTDEPAKWFRIALPTNAPVWVHTDFINVTNKTVVPNRLNLRGGPSENFSILGRLSKGTVVKEVEVRGDWIRIEPPTNGYAFVAAHLLEKVPPAPQPEPSAKPPETTVKPPETTVVLAPATQPKPAVDQPAPAPTIPATPTPVVTPTPEPTLPTAPAITETPIKRVVTREGWVRRTASPHAPTYFELESRDTKKIINYLYSTSPDIDIKKLRGRLISITGEESLDERWPNTPVITVETLEILY
jgi:uncharacterized protein YgiM (DUF1202 family)